MRQCFNIYSPPTLGDPKTNEYLIYLSQEINRAFSVMTAATGSSGTLHNRTHSLMNPSDHSNIASYIDQPLITTASPAFNALFLTGATAGLYFGDTGQTSPAGRFNIRSNSDSLLFQGKDVTDVSYDTILTLYRPDSGTNANFSVGVTLPSLNIGTLGGILIGTAGVVSAITNNSANWNTAYGWGNHASAGYVTGTPWTALGYLTTLTTSTPTNLTGFIKGNGSVLSADNSTYYKSGDTVTFANITDSGLTITRIPYASTAGLLIDSAGFTYAADGDAIMCLTANALRVANITTPYYVPYFGATGRMIGAPALTFDGSTLSTARFTLAAGATIYGTLEKISGQNAMGIQCQAYGSISFGASAGWTNTAGDAVMVGTGTWKLNGTLKLVPLSTGVAHITDGIGEGVITSSLIVNADVSLTAGIALGKLENCAAYSFVGRSAGVGAPYYYAAANLHSLNGLTYASTSFVKMTASGTFGLDTNVYYKALTDMALAQNSFYVGNAANNPEAKTVANVKTLLSYAQADISGLTTADGPTFDHLHITNAIGCGAITATGASLTAMTTQGIVMNAATTGLLSSNSAATLKTFAGYYTSGDSPTFAGLTLTAFAGVLHASAGVLSASAVIESDITLADNATLNVSNTKHGLVPKCIDDTTKYLRSDGSYAVPSDSGSLTGWGSISEALTYQANDDDPTYRMTADTDLTTKYSVGMKIKVTNTTVKYFIITAIDYNVTTANKTVFFIYGGTDYNLVNAAITAAYYSFQKAPFGFPMNPTKWTVEVTDASDRGQVAATNAVWYNLGAITISIPIGVWNFTYQLALLGVPAAGSNWALQSTLSTASVSESDTYWSSLNYSNLTIHLKMPITKTGVITVAVKTPYYLNARSTNSTNTQNIYFTGVYDRTILRAVCAYL